MFFSTREDALEKLVKIFTFKYVRDCLENYHETTLERIKKAIIKGSTSKEKILGAKLLELLFLTVEWNSESHFLEIVPTIKKIIKDGKSNDVRAALVHTLAICCFVSDVDPNEVAELMNFYLQLATSSELPQNILLSILNSYGLLFTGLGYGGQSFMRKQFDDSIAFHVKCLDSTDPAIRISTGENIAVMFETLGAHDEEREIYPELPDLLDKLHAIATDSAKYRSKKERSHQRSAFRDIIPTVESGILPEIKLKFKRCHIYFDSWNKIKQLQNFRITLAGGFSVHIDRNELLHQIFGSSMIYSQSNLGIPGSPRIINSPNSRVSKARTQKKSQSMLSRQNALSIGVEEDYI